MAVPPDNPGEEPLPIVAPIVEAPWSAEFVAQALEVFIVCRDPRGLANLRPVHADSLRLAMAVGREPADLVLAAVARYDLRPIVVHSTSWRSEPGRIILSTSRRSRLPSRWARSSSRSRSVAPSSPQRSDGRSSSIGTLRVLEHALRHLSWLVRDDRAVQDALAAWSLDLDAYVPEPFRNL
jgi:hypothetical protein